MRYHYSKLIIPDFWKCSYLNFSNTVKVDTVFTMKGKYGFDLLLRHSNNLSLESRRIFKEEMAGIRDVFRALDALFGQLHDLPKSHLRNVKMALTARFTNHLFSQVLLTERGLILDAINSARSATETTAFYWLVCVDSENAKKYDAQSSPRPVEIRKTLEALGIDVSDLRGEYQAQSTASHVGNPTDNWQIDWKNEKDGLLMIGGGKSLDLQRMLLHDAWKSVLQFVKHDPSFDIVPKE